MAALLDCVSDLPAFPDLVADQLTTCELMMLGCRLGWLPLSPVNWCGALPQPPLVRRRTRTGMHTPACRRCAAPGVLKALVARRQPGGLSQV